MMSIMAAHKHIINPKAQLFKKYYLDSSSPDTFGNITQSALKAGFSATYANNLSGHTNVAKWYTDFVKQGDYLRANMLKKAESRLSERLNEAPEDAQGIKLQTDVAKFVSERVGKEFYSTRQEVTGADGRRLFNNKTQSNANIAIADLFKKQPQKQDT